MKNNLTARDANNITYVYPKSEEIVIPRSDLQIQLEKFKKRVQATFSIFDLLAILSLWAPVFSADFKPMLNFEAIEIRAGYAVLAIMVTVFLLFSRIKYFGLSFFNKDSVSSSSEKMANKILEQCQSKPKVK